MRQNGREERWENEVKLISPELIKAYEMEREKRKTGNDNENESEADEDNLFIVDTILNKRTSNGRVIKICYRIHRDISLIKLQHELVHTF